jgi:DmsE family decaheme c-type cytochrome
VQLPMAVRRIRLTPRRFGVLCLLALGIASCAHEPDRTVGDASPDSEYFRLGWPKVKQRWQEERYPELRVAYPKIKDAEFIHDDELCMTCHETYAKSFAHNVHREQKCEDCHGPASLHLKSRGKEKGTIWNPRTMPPAEAAELCLKCHEKDACTPGATWRTSVHAHKNVTCGDCHRAHYNIPVNTPPTKVAANDNSALLRVNFETRAAAARQEPKAAKKRPSLRGKSYHLAAITPHVCYRCHKEKHQLEVIAHPHQIGGKNGFNCTTCHDPHGKILASSRKDLCLTCHKGAPTSAWHSSTHNLVGVSCTDCHNPHPNSRVQRFVDIQHTQVNRAKRMPMSVNEPGVCYKCHTAIYAKNAMPSHHPIKEGKLVCTACHDPHGQAQGNLKEERVNMVCYKCHADKQGPFVYEHPPVTQDCTICHDPHGTVANNLLKQPPTFLCLRCHTGHRVGPTFGPHTGAGLVDVGTSPALQRAFYSSCTQCHSQIHGSDRPSPHNPHALVR